MKIRLLVLDVDGTITDDDGNISRENIEAVEKAVAMGAKVAIATGRTKQGVQRVMDELNLGRETPLILANGALVLSGDEVWLMDFMCSEDARQVISYAKGLGNVVISIFNPDKAYYWIPSIIERSWTIDRMHSFDFADIKEVGNPEELPSDSVSKIMLMATSVETAKQALTHWPDSLKHLEHGHSYPYLCEINSPSAEKGRGLDLVCQKLNLEPSEVLAVGDGGTDLPLFERSGHAVFIKRTDTVPKLPGHVAITPEDRKNTGIAWTMEKYGQLFV